MRIVIHTGRCQSPLGVADDNRISNDQMSASNQTVGHPVKYGRLNGDTAWRPNRVNAPDSAGGEWIQITFDKPVKVTAIATQGRNSDDEVGNIGKEWVIQYKVRYSNDGSRWMYVLDEENNASKVRFCFV